ncbi:MAG: hypothetical protein SFV51_07655 [Bryobacteraceae bacterium]|nr:hypothetical protein [Bryobacteraceae bacterium]
MLGVPLVVLLAVAGEALGMGGAQVLVGAGAGMGVGLLQARQLRGTIDRPIHWFWSCAAGLSLPFAATDITRAARWDLPYTLYVSVACGGFLAGVWQAMLLRRRFQATWWWIAASTLGWSLASATAAAADALQRGGSLPRGIWGALAYLAIIATGGLGLGVVTAVALGLMSRRRDL